MSANLVEHVAPLEDLRIDRNKLHGLVDMVLLTICAVASGADGWEAINLFSSVDFDRTAVSSVRERACIRTGGSPNG